MRLVVTGVHGGVPQLSVGAADEDSCTAPTLEVRGAVGVVLDEEGHGGVHVRAEGRDGWRYVWTNWLPVYTARALLPCLPWEEGGVSGLPGTFT